MFTGLSFGDEKQRLKSGRISLEVSLFGGNVGLLCPVQCSANRGGVEGRNSVKEQPQQKGEPWLAGDLGNWDPALTLPPTHDLGQ